VVLGDIVTFACAAIFGPTAAIIAAVADGAVTSLRITKSPYKFAYNVAVCAVSMGGAGFAAKAIFPAFGERTAQPVVDVIVQIGLFSVFFFFIETFLVAGYVAAAERTPFFKMWRENFIWTSVSYVASGGSALAAYFLVARYGYYVFLIPVGLIMVVFYFYRSYFKKVDSANQKVGEMEELNFRTIETLIASIGAVGYATKMNVRRVEHLTVELGTRAGCSEEEMKALRLAAVLHDIGNIAVPQHILEKPGALTSEEYDKIKTHTILGAKIVESMGFPYPVAELVRHHHERFDGMGYPDGLEGEQIPLTARVLGIVDCYNALTIDRPYRPRLSRRHSVEIMKEQSGKAFDPVLLTTFFEIIGAADEEACKAQSEAIKLDELQAEIMTQRRLWLAA
jgi:putative nucleotidyltransferase with HDIG domain